MSACVLPSGKSAWASVYECVHVCMCVCVSLCVSVCHTRDMVCEKVNGGRAIKGNRKDDEGEYLRMCACVCACVYRCAEIETCVLRSVCVCLHVHKRTARRREALKHTSHWRRQPKAVVQRIGVRDEQHKSCEAHDPVHLQR